MGCFSWMFANSDNKKALKNGRKGYLIFPNNTYVAESSYEGYGEFSGLDVYDLVADWNREYLSQHPEYLVPQPMRYNPKTEKWCSDAIRVSDFSWYPFYSDLSMSRKAVVEKVYEATGHRIEWRYIGIDIACYDEQNAKLPYPIKISSSRHVQYEELPPSKSDPNQGCG